MGSMCTTCSSRKDRRCRRSMPSNGGVRHGSEQSRVRPKHVRHQRRLRNGKRKLVVMDLVSRRREKWWKWKMLPSEPCKVVCTRKARERMWKQCNVVNEWRPCCLSSYGDMRGIAMNGRKSTIGCPWRYERMRGRTHFLTRENKIDI